MSPDPDTPAGWWHCRSLRDDGSVAAFTVVQSDRQADGTRVDLPEAQAAEAIGDGARCVARFDEQGDVSALEVQPSWAPRAPALWFAELPEPDAAPPATHLIAFTGAGVDPGRLLRTADLRGTGVRSDDQLGAIHWWVGTGEIDQIYVSPTARRQQIATALLMAAGTLAVARGWGRIWSDGQRTALGDRLAQRPDWRHRADELTHLAPPMTPFDERDD